MRYVYPAILFSDDDKIGVTVPDLPGCHTFGEDKADALSMAKDAIEMWLWHAENTERQIPPPTEGLVAGLGEILTLVVADTDEYRRQNDNKSVRKTVTVPAWLNHRAVQSNAPFSQILQNGLKEYLGIGLEEKHG